jgi:hypothetical protein
MDGSKDLLREVRLIFGVGEDIEEEEEEETTGLKVLDREKGEEDAKAFCFVHY